MCVLSLSLFRASTQARTHARVHTCASTNYEALGIKLHGIRHHLTTELVLTGMGIGLVELAVRTRARTHANAHARTYTRTQSRTHGNNGVGAVELPSK